MSEMARLHCNELPSIIFFLQNPSVSFPHAWMLHKCLSLFPLIYAKHIWMTVVDLEGEINKGSQLSPGSL